MTRENSLGLGFWATLLVGVAWSLYRALMNEGWIQDDELSHYLISKDVWSHISELWHPWSRPGRNILQCVPAFFGLDAARLWTLGLSTIAVWMTGREAKRLGMPGLWMLPLLICFQWWFPELSYPVLTQGPFMLVWIAGVFFAVRGKYALAAICWGYLGMVRHEGIALTAMWGVWVIFAEGGFARYLFTGKVKEAISAFPRAVVLGMWTILPMALMNLFTWWTRGEIPFMMFFEPKPTEMYGAGPIWLYSAHLLLGAGLPVAILMLLGIFRKGWNLRWDLMIYATYPAYLALHSIIYWKGLFASGGYYHFIMPMAPWVGLLALRGANGLQEKIGPKPMWAILLLTIWGGLAIPQQQYAVADGHIPGMPEVKKEWKPICPPMAESRIGAGARQAAKWMEDNVTDQKWLSHHVAVYYYLNGVEVGERLETWGGHEPETISAGTVLVWDSQYSVGTHDFTLERLERAGWNEVESFAHGTVRVFIKA